MGKIKEYERHVYLKVEVTLFLFADVMILFIKTLKTAPKNSGRTNEFNTVARYQTNIPKTVAFLYTNNKISEKDIRKPIPFTVA